MLISVRLAAALLVATAASSLSAGPAAARATATDQRTIWLCRPGLPENPCLDSLTTTVVDASGARHIERSRAAARPSIDCFYVYPTVSAQTTLNANRRVDPELTAIARAQAARFSQVCRMFAPVYRQTTFSALANPALVTAAAQDLAYSDVRTAWREYLRRHNRGRGVVLVGHSQGARMLTRLIADDIDRRPSHRRRLVSALLPGGNVFVSAGRDVGGDFEHVRACRRARQTGCVVTYSAFNEPPPADSLFGRVETALLRRPNRPGLQVLCVNPASLSGGSGPLRPYFPTKRLPPPIGAIQDDPPSAPTPWVSMPRLYSARCLQADGASWLQVDDIGGPRDTRQRVTQTLGSRWGLHVLDVNIALGNLVALVRRQAAAYAAANAAGSARAVDQPAIAWPVDGATRRKPRGAGPAHAGDPRQADRTARTRRRPQAARR